MFLSEMAKDQDKKKHKYSMEVMFSEFFPLRDNSIKNRELCSGNYYTCSERLQENCGQWAQFGAAAINSNKSSTKEKKTMYEKNTVPFS